MLDDCSHNEFQRAAEFRFDGRKGVPILCPSGMYIFKGMAGFDSLEEANELFLPDLGELGVSWEDSTGLDIWNVVSNADIGYDLR